RLLLTIHPEVAECRQTACPLRPAEHRRRRARIYGVPLSRPSEGRPPACADRPMHSVVGFPRCATHSNKRDPAVALQLRELCRLRSRPRAQSSLTVALGSPVQQKFVSRCRACASPRELSCKSKGQIAHSASVFAARTFPEKN